MKNKVKSITAIAAFGLAALAICTGARAADTAQPLTPVHATAAKRVVIARPNTFQCNQCKVIVVRHARRPGIHSGTHQTETAK